MTVGKNPGARPMNVFVKPGSKAELACRRYAAKQEVAAKQAPAQPPHAALIASGFAAHKELNLHDQGGKIIKDLTFTNFFVGGDAWNAQDIQSIDENLAKAMSDQHLNNVLIQYFRGAANITTTFLPSTTLPGAPPQTMSQPDVENLLTQIHGAGTLVQFDFANTVFNFMLSPGTVLTIDDGSDDKGPAGHAPGEVEKESSSLNGLGGFHGSVQVGADTLFYAVGVFSEGNNGIVAFDQPWKNVVATFYHELNEARTDAGVENGQVAWVNNENPSEEIGDIPMTLAGADLSKVMKEVALADGSGTVPIQLMWSDAVAGPEGPIAQPHGPAH
jgi:hypothetical protein